MSKKQTMSTKQAEKYIEQWPEPYKTYVAGNIKDAVLDLSLWPDRRKEILRDMTEAIYAWKEEIDRLPENLRIRIAKAPMMASWADLLEAVVVAYEEMYHENMSCPWCMGHIGKGSTRHDKYCTSHRINAMVGLYKWGDPEDKEEEDE